MNFIKMRLPQYDVSIYLKTNWFFSFGDSPYYAHYNGSAIDLYEGARGFKEKHEAISPISGKVVFIKKVRTPKRKGYLNQDYLIGIKSEENESLFFRILHVLPTVAENEVINVGDQLGYFIRSGFFHPWTDPHLHIELRNNLEKFHIARDVLPILEEKTTILNTLSIPSSQNYSLTLRVDIVSEDYYLAKPEKYCTLLLQDSIPVLGIPLLQTVPNILDAGIPYYERGLLLLPITHINTKNIGLEYISLFSKDFSLKITNSELNLLSKIRGIGTAVYLANDNLHVKLVPAPTHVNGKFSIEEGDLITLKISYRK